MPGRSSRRRLIFWIATAVFLVAVLFFAVWSSQTRVVLALLPWVVLVAGAFILFERYWALRSEPVRVLLNLLLLVLATLAYFLLVGIAQSAWRGE